ncbi:MAG: hypothetical protein ACR2GO_03175 [Candidatus Limnocylindria bacterium]
MRLGLALVAGAAWLVTLPLAAAALLNTEESWATMAFVPAALLTAGVWWKHMKERERRIGLAGTMSGWLFIGALGLLGVSGFLWVLVAMALVASAMAYGVVLLVTQARAASPRPELITGLALFATAGATAMFTITTGLPQTEAWWMPAHWILGLGLGVATMASGLPSGDVQAAPASVSTRGR